MRMPVYALFTKADLIAGFTEFFDDLDREKRDQVWGVTFPLATPRPARSPASPTSCALWSPGWTSACSTACRPSAARNAAR